MPRCSVVVPAYQAEDLVGQTVASVLRQRERDLEVVVVDDGSTDRTAEVVAAIAATDERVRLISQPNAGLSGARNTGIRASSGELVAVLDADDLWLPGYLDAATRALDADPGAGFAYCDAWALDETTSRFERVTTMALTAPPVPPPVEPEPFLLELVQRNFIFSSVAFRADVLPTTGLYDVALRQCEDLEMSLRVLAHGFRAVRMDGLPAIKRTRPGSLSSDVEGQLVGLAAAYREVVEHHPAPPAVKAAARARLAATLADLEAHRGAGALRRTGWAARRGLSRARRRLQARRYLLDEPPAEVVRAVPELAPHPRA